MEFLLQSNHKRAPVPSGSNFEVLMSPFELGGVDKSCSLVDGDSHVSVTIICYTDLGYSGPDLE